MGVIMEHVLWNPDLALLRLSVMDITVGYVGRMQKPSLLIQTLVNIRKMLIRLQKGSQKCFRDQLEKR
jgi:hypothetical protein